MPDLEIQPAGMYEFWLVPEPGHRGAPPGAVGGLALYAEGQALGIWLDLENWRLIADVVTQGDMVLRTRELKN